MQFMRIILLIVFVIAFTFTALAQIATNVTLTNLQGRVYTNITLDHTNQIGLMY